MAKIAKTLGFQPLRLEKQQIFLLPSAKGTPLTDSRENTAFPAKRRYRLFLTTA